MRDEVECPHSPLDHLFSPPQQGTRPPAPPRLLWASAPGDPGAVVQVGTGSPGKGGTGSANSPWLGTGLSGYLQDDGADLPHTLDDGVWHP